MSEVLQNKTPILDGKFYIDEKTGQYYEADGSKLTAEEFAKRVQYIQANERFLAREQARLAAEEEARRKAEISEKEKIVAQKNVQSLFLNLFFQRKNQNSSKKTKWQYSCQTSQPKTNEPL